MKNAYWWLFIVRLSLRWIPRFNIGDKVWYRGEQWSLYQGVYHPKWHLCRGEERVEFVHESEFRKVRSLENYIGSFRSGYRFYMTAWFKIWVNEGIKSWMRGCNIWARG